APRDASRFRRMLQNSGVSIQARPLPQAEEVRKRLRERYHEVVTARVAEGTDERLRVLAQELLTYMEPLDLVSSLLQGDERASAMFEAGLDVPVPQVRPVRAQRAEGRVDARMDARSTDGPAKGFRTARPERTERTGDQQGDFAPKLGKDGKPMRKLSEHHEPGMTRIWLNQGKANRLAPGRLVQMVCAASGLKGDSVGAIAIHAHFAFFDVKEGEASRVVDLLNGLSFQGKKLKANLVPAAQQA
ncbi:MAG: DbpA RNA binding domain-containing protein, partial [Candidatus Sericytochromatia bacterium]